MNSEADNLPDEGGTDNAHPSEADTLSEWDYYDPGEDQDTEAVATEEGTEDEVEGEEVAENEAAEAPDSPDDEESEQDPITATEDAVVKLADGTTATVKDLISGNMRQDDYSRKTQQIANDRKALAENVDRIDRITQAFVDHLSTMVPPEPDPALALNDPAAYTRQKAQYDAAIAQVQSIIEFGNEPKEMMGAMSDEDRQKTLADENSKLIMMFPEAGTQDGRQQFFSEAQKAAEALGFSAEELGSVTDHRMFALAHWAQKGMQAAEAKKSVEAKTQKAPPSAPRKPGQPARKGGQNAKAMRKLAQTGSIHDAVKVDWD